MVDTPDKEVEREVYKRHKAGKASSVCMVLLEGMGGKRRE